MSMLTRTGTLVRKSRGSLSSRKGSGKRSSSRRSRASSSGSAGSFKKTQAENPVYDNTKSTDLNHHHASPIRSFADTILSFDDERQLVRTSVGWDSRHGGDLQPDYGAFTYQIQEAGKESDNVIEFACKTSNIICNTLIVTVLVGVSMTLPIAMVSVGVKYLDACPKEPRIPVYLLVGGCFGMIKLLSSLWRNIQARRYQDAEAVFDDQDADGAFASTTYKTMDTILLLFLIGWQVAGTYWTLDIWTPHFEQLLHEPSNWCDKTVYMFTLYQLFGCYGVLAVYVLILFILMCSYKCCKWQQA